MEVDRSPGIVGLFDYIKFGGWTVSNLNAYTDSARAIFSWSTTDGSNLLGIGTNSRVYVGAGTTLHDITPVYATYTNATSPSSSNCIGTTNGSKTVTVTITGHGATTGTYVSFSGIAGPTIGGIPVSEMNTTVQVTVLDSNTFTFQATTTATSTTTGQGGTGITVVIYMPAGFPIATAGYGWSTSTWGRSTWGSGSTSPIFQPARLIFMDKFNNDLVFNTQYDTVSTTGGEIYYWVYNTAFSNDAVLLKSLAGAVAVPQKVTKILFTPQGFLLALGCPACEDFTYDLLGGKTDAGLDRYSQEAMPRMVVHNTHLYVQAANEINQLVDSHVELLETVIPRDLYDVILSLHEMFADPDSAPQVYEKYIKTYKKFGGSSISRTDAENFNKFFKF